jgi:ubiquinone biosynthesis UbiH/UbiF/VisC/COQ6 family hydroxylase
MPTQFDVIVVGGGLVGASLAATLEPLGYSVALVEPHGAPRLPAAGAWDSRIYSISPGSAALLARCGAWSDVPPERICRIEAMQIYGDDVTASLRFSAYDAGLRELAFVVENGTLHHALWQRVAQSSGIRVYSPASCVSLLWEERKACLELAGGERLTAELVVGADGADSWVREQAGIETARMPYGETGVVANFAVSRPHRGVAYQWFGRHGVLALLPLPGDRMSMVWSTPDARAQDLLALTPDALCDAVAEASGYAVGSLSLATPAAGFPLKLQRVSRLVGAHVALVGDAAHSLHPLAGQGVNLGFRDVRDLAAVLGARGGYLNCGDRALLRRYERARAEDIAAMRLVTDGLQKLFRADAVWLARLRNLGLTLVGNLQPLKSLLIRHAIA